MCIYPRRTRGVVLFFGILRICGVNFVVACNRV